MDDKHFKRLGQIRLIPSPQENPQYLSIRLTFQEPPCVVSFDLPIRKAMHLLHGLSEMQKRYSWRLFAARRLKRGDLN